MDDAIAQHDIRAVVVLSQAVFDGFYTLFLFSV